MAINMAKLIVSAVLAVALIVAILVDTDSADWAVPLLALLVGYVVGNAQVSDISPIIKR